MTRIKSALSAKDSRREANAAEWRRLVDELNLRRRAAAEGGSSKARERHVARGKFLARERVAGLIDPGSPFLEIGALAAFGMYEGDVHGAGLIAGIGLVDGREVMIIANDPTIKGGAYYPMTVKKHLRAQEIAAENRSALRLSGQLGRSQSASPGRGVPRPRSFRADLLQPGAHVLGGSRPNRGRDGILHRGRRLCAGDVGRDDHRRQARHDFSRRAAVGQGGDRRDGERGGARRRRNAHPRLGRRRHAGARRRACARARAAGDRQPEPGAEAGDRVDEAGRALLSGRGA